MNPRYVRAVNVWLACLIVAAAAGCQPAADAAARPGAARADEVSVMVDSVNYMHERSVEYTLYDLSKTPPRAIGGAIVDRMGRGGDKGCCIALPAIWKPGVMVRLTWEEADHDKIYEKHSRDLEVPRYDTPADLFVVFYPGPEHDVELVVSAAEPGHPDWRGRIKKTPWEQCVATYGRKPCFLALPKRFDTNAKGVCTYFKTERRPDAELNCMALMHQCMTDYENESFCNGILWAPYKK